ARGPATVLGDRPADPRGTRDGHAGVASRVARRPRRGHGQRPPHPGPHVAHRRDGTGDQQGRGGAVGDRAAPRGDAPATRGSPGDLFRVVKSARPGQEVSRATSDTPSETSRLVADGSDRRSRRSWIATSPDSSKGCSTVVKPIAFARSELLNPTIASSWGTSIPSSRAALRIPLASRSS